MMPVVTQTLKQLAMELPASAFPATKEAEQSTVVIQAPAEGVVKDGGHAFFFGASHRRLFGILHQHPTQGARTHGALLIAAPLLQEGIMSQRALWSLCEGIAADGGVALRFDWYGSGDSAGDSRELALDGLKADLDAAGQWLHEDGRAVRILGLRSACLAVLDHATSATAPVDLVLWDPVLHGCPMIDAWRHQHLQQRVGVGRYLRPGDVQCAQDEMLGFDVQPSFVDALSRLDFRTRTLPSGSRVLLAAWGVNADTQAFIEIQQAAGISVEVVVLTHADQHPWGDPQQFENQALPRRSVAQLVNLLADTRA